MEKPYYTVRRRLMASRRPAARWSLLLWVAELAAARFFFDERTLDGAGLPDELGAGAAAAKPPRLGF